MDRADIMAAMGELKLYGMRAAYNELMAVAVRRQHDPRQIVGDLLAAEINEIEPACRHRFETAGEGRGRSNTRSPPPGCPMPGRSKSSPSMTPRSTTPWCVNWPAGLTMVPRTSGGIHGSILSQQRNVVLVGGTGTGKTHISVAIAHAVRVQSSGIVYLFDEDRQSLGDVGEGLVTRAIDLLDLQRLHEALRLSIVVGIADAAH